MLSVLSESRGWGLVSESGSDPHGVRGPDLVNSPTVTTHPEGGQPPLVVHVIHRLGIGGLENGVINLINHMPPERYRHAIVCLTDFTDFRDRLRRDNVPVIALQKREGHDLGLYARVWKVLRRLRPQVVHTRNLAAVECMVPAALLGVPGRVHSEHGLDMSELRGSNVTYNLLRKIVKPLVHRHVAVSLDLANWLTNTVGVPPHRLAQIYNGVDTRRFFRRAAIRDPIGPGGFAPQGTMVVGTVGRMEAVKDPLTLVRGFLHLLKIDPHARERVRLVMVGDGRLREEARRLLRASGAESLAWLPGERSDIPEILRGLDVFVLPSLREGISNTILEAMASGLPVVATRVGGNPELVDEGETGRLVPPGDPIQLAEAIRAYQGDPSRMVAHGQVGRKAAEVRFSLSAMVDRYLDVYDTVLNRRGQRPVGRRSGSAPGEE